MTARRAHRRTLPHRTPIELASADGFPTRPLRIQRPSIGPGKRATLARCPANSPMMPLELPCDRTARAPEWRRGNPAPSDAFVGGVEWPGVTSCYIERPQPNGAHSPQTVMPPAASSPTNPRDLFAQARAAFDRGQLLLAVERAEQLLQRAPGHAPAHLLAGQALLQQGQAQRALDHLHQAVQLQPDQVEPLVEFARVLAATRHSGDALQMANRAIALAPTDPRMLGTLGLVYSQCQAHERAAAAFRRAAALAPGDPLCRFNLAMALAFSGQVDACEAELEACLAIAPRCWPALALRSRLRRQTPDSNHVGPLQDLLMQIAGDPAQAQLHMALGKELEDLGDYRAAFAHFSAGKAASRPHPAYASAQDAALVEAVIRAFPADSAPQTSGCLTDEPIFVFGMPRSGTTLVERMLSSHPEVHPAGELENFPVALERLLGTRVPLTLDPAMIDRARGLPWLQLGNDYLESTRPATSLKPRFVDKLPHNFLFAGFIAQALPNARLICLRRHPLDTCLGNLREPFSELSPYHRYAFDLADIGRYFILFDRLMAHWRQVLPGRILEVEYEQLVESPEPMTRRLLAHCGLPFNEACLHIERNQAPTTTASTLQVRSPIHTAGVARWRNYQPELAGLRDRLTAAGIDCS